jgi:hypothetical protein
MKKILILMAVATVLFSTAATASDVCLITVNSELAIAKISCSFDDHLTFENKVQYRPASQTMAYLIQSKYQIQNVIILPSNNTMFTLIRP